MNRQAKYLLPVVPCALAFNAQQMAGERLATARLACLLLALAGLLALSQAGFAQVVQPAASAASARAGVKASASGLDWSQLTAQQQQTLAPLAATWNTSMSEPQKRKWLEISKNYGSLSPQAQATLNSRMKEWVAMSPQERAQARLNFGKLNEIARQLTPEEKKAQWEAYQALTPDEKQKLAATASPKPAGAATAVKPVAPQKLATVPFQAASKPAPTPQLSPLLPPTRPVSAPSAGPGPQG